MERLERALFRLEQGFELQFRLGPSLQGKEVQVFTNYPDEASHFQRLHFRRLDWIYPNGREDDCDKYCKLDLMVAGSYQYYFSCRDKEKVSGGYIVVDPVLRVGSDNHVLPLDSICSQWYQAKLLGPLEGWMDRLRVAKESGYNVIHFSPLQRLGASGCSFCVADQLELDPAFSSNGKPHSWDDVGKLVEVLRKDWNLICMTDVVYNQTAADSQWILQHPECTYNLVNTPSLKPAWLLDRALWHFSCEVADGKYTEEGLPPLIQDEKHLEALQGLLWEQVFCRLRLWEFLQVDVDEAVQHFRQLLESGGLAIPPGLDSQKELEMVQDPRWERFANRVDLSGALRSHGAHSVRVADIQEACSSFTTRVDQLNSQLYQQMTCHAKQAIKRIRQNLLHERLSPHGPKLGPVTRTTPLCPRYFTFRFEEMTFEEEVRLLMHRERASLLQALSGWKEGEEPLLTSAGLEAEAYLRREVEPESLSQCVLLRYGDSEEHCPQLWARFREYTRINATIFPGLRLLHCRHTPLHLSQAMLAEARAVRPDLYVSADVSSSGGGSGGPECSLFVEQLGLSSVEQVAVATTGAEREEEQEEERRFLCSLGGQPVGAFLQPSMRPLLPTAAHTIFSEVDPRRLLQNAGLCERLATSALVSMACCASGSIRGYDEMIPLQEMDVYRPWSPQEPSRQQVGPPTGMIAAKMALNQLHQELAAQGFTQVYVEQLGEGVMAVTRHCPSSHQSVVAVLRRENQRSQDHQHTHHVPAIFIPGQVEEVVFEGRTNVEKSISEWPQYSVQIQQHIQPEDSHLLKEVRLVSGLHGAVQEIHLDHFSPGCVIVLRVTLDSKSREQLGFLRRHLIQFSPQFQLGSVAEHSVPSVLGQPLMSVVARLTLAQLNVLLYRCQAEESQDGGGCYHIPSWRTLPYAGLQGFVSALAGVRAGSDLGHPLCENLRRGDWMMDFISHRLLKRGGALEEVGRWFQAMFGYVKNIPRYLVPCYFDAIVQGAYASALQATFKHMSSFVQSGSSLVKQLALGSLQMYGEGHCPPLSAASARPTEEQRERRSLSLAAGLPERCSGELRCWGRDTFIALRGLMLLTGRHQEAQSAIVSWASMLRYGLIPQLLGAACAPRYASRDAVWWWLQSIQDYCALVPQGLSILRCAASRTFPTNVSAPQPAGAWEQPLYQLIQEVMQRHMQGISFSEGQDWSQLTANMDHQGLQVEAGVDQSTGFVFGGNPFNCGTWMDKIGESQRAHNKGVAATPRDGSAVEIVGLCKSAVRWLVKLHEEGHFPYAAVTVRRGGRSYSVSYVEWDRMIQENFEDKFYISHVATLSEQEHPELVHKRGIYKDSFGASNPWCDYQLRPNFPIAMVMAPELFTVDKAWEALGIAEEKLLGSLGIRTLDPDDLVYCQVYDCNLDNDSFQQAKGFSCHQGPEWLWPLGFFLRAKLYFAKKKGKETYEETVGLVKSVLSRHANHLERSPWKGLPALSGQPGSPYSAGSQAASMATLLEVLYDL